MPEIEINVLALVASVAIYLGIGFVWYGPLFGSMWMKLVGLSKEQTQKASATPLVAATVLGFIQAFVLRHFIVYASNYYPTYSDASVGLLTAIWAWVGLVLPALGTAYLFALRRKKLLAIDALYNFVALAAIGYLLATWV